ncbi:PPOX class F420-dependent oxidoreductase [Nonomuraea guangzhouensis]|uniref:PPOX class F420-dependent oxidoreductase n=1 Tax=Nonomuraea guangzhouensis TaxID=1291555 RepID=A0ABW4GT34_9ACTN|nr:PPOX class F420-dependent oxidoreductase [Nonomuraea guangzhouensis]
MDLDEARDFLRNNHRAILLTRHGDGRPQMSPVTVGVDDEGYVVISTRETAAKTRNIRRDNRVAICAFTDAFYGNWIQVEGEAEIIPLPDAMDHLIAYYRGISGEHPDWADYEAAMVRDKRVIVRVTPVKAGPDRHG